MPKKSHHLQDTGNSRPASVKPSRRIQSAGRILPDGSIIELVRPFKKDDRLALLFSRGKTHVIRTRLSVGNQILYPPEAENSIFKVMRFPQIPRNFGSVAELLGRISALFSQYTGLSSEYAGMLGRFALCTWIAENLPVRPRLHFLGPSTRSGMQALELIECVCRHPLRLARIDLTAIASIPTGLRPTIIVHQQGLSRSCRQLLNLPNHRAGILRSNGAFIPVEFTTVSYSEHAEDIPSSHCSIVIPILTAGENCPLLPTSLRIELAAELQDQLLSYRIQMLRSLSEYEVRDTNFGFGFADLGRSLMLCTPQNADLQAEVSAFLQGCMQEVRLKQSATPDAAVVEALLFFVHEGQDRVHVGAVADATNEILRRRCELYQLHPRAIGNVLRNLGLEPKQRDSAGIRLILMREVRCFIHQLARNLAVPSADCQPDKCDLCIATENN